jgi:hypothetical protein
MFYGERFSKSLSLKNNAIIISEEESIVIQISNLAL